MCESCGLIYDPADGDPDGGIPPGTAFEDIPVTWVCPVCGARKAEFVPCEDDSAAQRPRVRARRVRCGLERAAPARKRSVVSRGRRPWSSLMQG
ncbi:MAG TPA: rubredoxin [Conexibacter sp.]|nr:rubredoxin [Conexibacter sp.]